MVTWLEGEVVLILLFKSRELYSEYSMKRLHMQLHSFLGHLWLPGPLHWDSLRSFGIAV